MRMPERSFVANAMDRGWWLSYVARHHGIQPEKVDHAWHHCAKLYRAHRAEKIRFQYWGESL